MDEVIPILCRPVSFRAAFSLLLNERLPYIIHPYDVSAGSEL